MQWLREGNANLKFFHSIMSGKHRRNAIQFFMVEGVLIEGVDKVRATVFSHFSSHFQSRRLNRPSMDGIQFRSLSHQQGTGLIKPFSVEEVKAVVWDCDNYKCSGPDGISFENLQRLIDFRHISLVSSMYKILAKILANRLRLVIGSLISDSQSAFIKGCQILDGILVANEVVDEARKCKKELILFKVDFEKAYDSVDWNHLCEVMVKMGLPTLWHKWIKECIGAATASVLVNGSPADEFPLERGLRQGDPLSAFLFLLAAEGFHVLMHSLSESNLFFGYKVGRSNF